MIAYKAKRFSIDEKKTMLPNGNVANVISILHNGSVAILAADGKDLILTSEYRPVIKKWMYSIPAGTIEQNESPLHCAKREIQEELGYSAGKMLNIFNSYASPGISTEFMHFFLATDLIKTRQKLEPHEVIKIRRTSLAKAVSMIRNGKINDSKAIQAILYYKDFIL
jgi:ADP-ribose pyrophosphatase